MPVTRETFMSAFQIHLLAEGYASAKSAPAEALHRAVGRSVLSLITGRWQSEGTVRKRACYLSAEFLLGRLVYNNLYCMGMLDDVRAWLAEVGADISTLEEINDPALGNGGLGRLAACFLDSAAALGLPLTGYGIRYKYGLFKQSFERGFQKETADGWHAASDPWSVRREDMAQIISFSDQTLRAVPYDMPIIGYGETHTGTLRLWEAEPLDEFDFDMFNRQRYGEAVSQKNEAEDICRTLYPNDDTPRGKKLRLRQQYFFSAATIADLMDAHKRAGLAWEEFPAQYAIQLNDTHPVIAIVEMIRRLMDIEGIAFAEALEISRQTFHYTNHTIMAEALEKWNIGLIRNLLPRHMEIFRMIQKQFEQDMKRRRVSGDTVKKLSILREGRAHMAHLAIYASSHTNGVARIHTELLKNRELKEWYGLYPERFMNETNGITFRRWLGLCNPELAGLVNSLSGGDVMRTPDLLENLRAYQHDGAVLAEFAAIKKRNKLKLARHIAAAQGVAVDPDSVFDIHIKRLHEYKRQLMNALHILMLYHDIKDGVRREQKPVTFIFGAKAAPGYVRAKAIIKLINEIARLVRTDAATRDLLNVVFVQNYNVSYAEKLVVAADISEQISMAGTEASGTGNMKFMLNGTVTLGTYDGANVEIVESAGIENNYIFGARVEELVQIMPTYDPNEIVRSNARVARVMGDLTNGLLDDGGTGAFEELRDALLKGASWHKPDHYYVIGDLAAYGAVREKAFDQSGTPYFIKQSWLNMCSAGRFSSDKTVAGYAKDIWGVE